MPIIAIEVGKHYPEIIGNTTDSFTADLMFAADFDFEYDECPISMKCTSRRGGPLFLILDFEGVEGLCALAIGTITSVAKKLEDRGDCLKIVNPPPKVARLFKMLNHDDLLDEDDE